MKLRGLQIFFGLGGLVFMPALASAPDQPQRAAAAEAGQSSMSVSAKPGEKTETRILLPCGEHPGQATTTKTDAEGRVSSKTIQIQPGATTKVVTKSVGMAPVAPKSEAGAQGAPKSEAGAQGAPKSVAMAPVVPKSVPIFFETDSVEIEPVSLPLLDATAAAINGTPKIKTVAVEGHADARGDSDYNVDLATRRAEAVNQALQERGVSVNRLENRGFGASQPICAANDEDCWSQNRRVDIVPGEAGE